MKTIDKDEWCPVYSIIERPEYANQKDWKGVYPVVEITPEFQSRYDRITQEFGELQDELAEMLEKAKKARKKTGQK